MRRRMIVVPLAVNLAGRDPVEEAREPGDVPPEELGMKPEEGVEDALRVEAGPQTRDHDFERAAAGGVDDEVG